MTDGIAKIRTETEAKTKIKTKTETYISAGNKEAGNSDSGFLKEKSKDKSKADITEFAFCKSETLRAISKASQKSLKKGGGKRIGALYILASAVFLIFTLGPFIWAFLISVTPEYEMFTNTTAMLPSKPTLANYAELLDLKSQYSIRFTSGLFNSLKAVGITLLFGLPTATLTAYAISRMRFAGKAVFKYGLLITMVIPVFATIIPLFRIFSVNKLLDNTFWLSLVYVSSFLPMNTWLISNYFATIPRELEEAARVDGCSRMQCFLHVILPVSAPILISSALIMFLSAWGQYQIPLILASSAATKPVSIVTSEFMTKDTIFYGVTAAGGLLAILPPAIAALLLRRYLVNGMTHGSVK